MNSAGRTIKCGDQYVDLSCRSLVMGIVNVTPDSFSDGGKYLGRDLAVAHGLSLLQDGADILDIGGESTRPGAQAVSPKEEQERVLPVIQDLVQSGVRAISIDTRHASTAEKALEAGASWVNDVMGFRDPDMARVACHADAYVLMHARDTPEKMQHGQIEYTNVVRHIRTFFEERISYAEDNGLLAEKIILDPGIGFGKTLEHNLSLTTRIGEVRVEGTAGILYGPSRKKFLGQITGIEDADERDAATLGAVSVAVLNGAHVVRVHDVKNTMQLLKVINACQLHEQSIAST